jgi:hypothetical protein
MKAEFGAVRRVEHGNVARREMSFAERVQERDDMREHGAQEALGGHATGEAQGGRGGFRVDGAESIVNVETNPARLGRFAHLVQVADVRGKSVDVRDEGVEVVEYRIRLRAAAWTDFILALPRWNGVKLTVGGAHGVITRDDDGAGAEHA